MAQPAAGPGRKPKRKGSTRAAGTASPWAQGRPHANAVFDLDYYTSDECPNSKFLELLTKVLRTHRVHSMRSFLNALHSSNLVLQSKTDVFRLITGKDSKAQGEPELRAAMLRYAGTELELLAMKEESGKFSKAQVAAQYLSKLPGGERSINQGVVLQIAPV